MFIKNLSKEHDYKKENTPPAPNQWPLVTIKESNIIILHWKLYS